MLDTHEGETMLNADEGAAMSRPSADSVATDIVSKDTDGLGAAKFEGWLAGEPGDPDPSPATFRCYTHPQFLEWLEIATDDILGQVPTTGRPAGGSTIWVKRGAKIKRCQVGQARYFEELAAGASIDDPAATRYPPPPH